MVLKKLKIILQKKEFEKTMSCLDPCKKATTSVPHPQSHTKKKPRMRFSIAWSAHGVIEILIEMWSGIGAKVDLAKMKRPLLFSNRPFQI
jgi:hypothetical protein